MGREEYIYIYIYRERIKKERETKKKYEQSTPTTLATYFVPFRWPLLPLARFSRAWCRSTRHSTCSDVP